jgi:hypothetical protein
MRSPKRAVMIDDAAAPIVVDVDPGSGAPAHPSRTVRRRRGPAARLGDSVDAPPATAGVTCPTCGMAYLTYAIPLARSHGWVCDGCNHSLG